MANPFKPGSGLYPPHFAGRGRYPKIINRIGESPPRYPGFEDDEVDSEED